MTAERLAELRDYYVNKKDITLLEIVEEFDMNTVTLNRIVQKHDWPRRGRTSRLNKGQRVLSEQVKKIGEMYAEGFEIKSILSRFGIKAGTFKQIRKQQGWPLRG